ncbi:TPA: hypothetical protein ACH3X1_000676 [Trebouxia sp. C0004]
MRIFASNVTAPGPPSEALNFCCQKQYFQSDLQKMHFQRGPTASAPTTAPSSVLLLLAAAKRYKVTGTGKVILRHPGKQHINEKKSSKRLSNLGKAHLASDRDLPGIIGNLPYKKIKKSQN